MTNLQNYIVDLNRTRQYDNKGPIPLNVKSLLKEEIADIVSSLEARSASENLYCDGEEELAGDVDAHIEYLVAVSKELTDITGQSVELECV